MTALGPGCHEPPEGASRSRCIPLRAEHAETVRKAGPSFDEVIRDELGCHALVPVVDDGIRLD